MSEVSNLSFLSLDADFQACGTCPASLGASRVIDLALLCLGLLTHLWCIGNELWR